MDTAVKIKHIPQEALSQKILLKLIVFPLFVLIPFTVIMVVLWDYLMVSKHTYFNLERLIYHITLVKTIPLLNIKLTPLATIFITDIISFVIYCWHISPIFRYLKTGENPQKAEYSIFTGFNRFYWLGYIVLAYLYGTFFTEEIADLGDGKIIYLMVTQIFIALIWSIFVLACMMFIRISCAPVVKLIGRKSIFYKEAIFLDKILSFLPAAFFVFGVSLIYYRAVNFLFFYGRIHGNKAIPPMTEQFPFIALLLIMFLFMILGLNYLVSSTERQERTPIQQELDALAQGKADLTQRLFIPAPNSRGIFVSDFNKFLEKFQRQTTRLKGSVKEIGTGVGELQKNFSKISESEEFQKKEITPISASVSQISEGMKRLIHEVKEKYDYISVNLRHIDEIAQGIEDIITFFQGIKKQSFNSLSTANIVMKQIQESMEKSRQMTESMALISKKIQEAGQEAEHIDEILTLIQDISEQTNILSINAAIEAAHAGDDGKGFAIVANEVRTLATESSKAVEQISKKLLDIQILIRNSVDMTISAEAITKENGVLVAESYNIINDMIEQFHKTGRITQNTAAIIAQQGDITRSFHKQIRSLMIFFESLRSTMLNQESSFEELHETLGGLQESFSQVSAYNLIVGSSISDVARTETRLSGMVNVFKTE